MNWTRSAAAAFLLFFCAIVIVPAPADAHELLPVQLVEFLQTHPQFTQQDVNDYLSAHPELTKGDSAYQGRLVDTVFAAKIGFWDNGFAFIRLGIRHILEGTDHILFIASLLLTFMGLRQMLKSITAFTIAHSITLILAGLQIITLEQRLVESMVALSIAVVAIGTVFFKRYKFFSSMDTKVSLIFLFGMFHGMGFAGLLKSFAIPPGQYIPSLLFFNVGIEIGQIGIILMIVPLIFAFRRKHWYPYAIKLLAAVIG
ncbi:MAG TPA: HupE/UreJ family protein, partial [Candidatus Peribacteria bacterium]|nr:HupE/UreJ family protein [Candidatus Peribacteria bacterium]